MIRIRIPGFSGAFSIRRQLIIGVATVHLLLMSVFVYDLTARQRTFLTERAKDRILYQVNALATSSLPYIIVDDVAGLTEIMDAFSGDRSVRYAFVTDPNGKVLGHSDRGKSGQHLEDSRSLAVLKGPAQAQLLFASPLTVQAAAPIMVRGKTLGWAWLGVDRSGDQQYLDYVTRAGLLYTLSAVLIGTIFAIALGNTITRPLRSLLLGAKRLSQDRLDVPVPVIAKNEVGVVARAFNAAMERLARQRTDLQNEIAERQRAEEALRRANASLARSNRDLEQFAYAASHDLQEPLRTIKNFTSLLGRRYRDRLDVEANEFIGYIVDGATRMETLIRDLLAYSRAAGSDSVVDLVDSGAALQSALRNLHGAIESSGAKIACGELPQITANSAEMIRLFQNLVGNAIKYRSERAPEVHVEAAKSGTEWTFEVRDNGMGIPAPDRERIFGLFYRLHGKELPGSGIGLATCTKLVEHHGGRIWVESEVGVGSRFKFTIPDAPVGAAERQTELASSSS
jgi:signal transduction histidine kinase